MAVVRWGEPERRSIEDVKRQAEAFKDRHHAVEATGRLASLNLMNDAGADPRGQSDLVLPQTKVLARVSHGLADAASHSVGLTRFCRL
jgi:hypothetical protein